MVSRMLAKQLERAMKNWQNLAMKAIQLRWKWQFSEMNALDFRHAGEPTRGRTLSFDCLNDDA